MIRVIPKGGHIPGGNVQQVLWASRAIRYAPSGRATVIDHRHLERMCTESRQIHRGHYTAETTSDYGDVFRC